MEIPSRSAAETGVLSYQRKTARGDVETRLVAHASLRLLGFVCAFLGFGVIAFFLITAWWAAKWGRWDMPIVLSLSPFAMFGASGIVYWACGFWLYQGSATAALVALGLALLHLLLFLLFAVASAILTFNGLYLAIVPLIVSTLFILGLGDLMRNLYRFLRARSSH